MSKITQLNDKAWSVTIPPEGNINNAYLWGSYNQWWVRYTEMARPGQFVTREIKLPEGSWGIVGVGSSLTEDQWKGIVEQIEVMSGDDLIDGFKDYCDPVHGYVSPTSSGFSLLKSKGLNPGNTLILIKQ